MSKIKYGIYIDEGVYNGVLKYINNIDQYIESCLRNCIKYNEKKEDQSYKRSRYYDKKDNTTESSKEEEIPIDELIKGL